MSLSKFSVNKIINSRFFSSLRLPLYRNGLALVISMVATSGLGLLYWALAARNFSPSVVGINTAILSAMMFLSHISQFGLVNFLHRFLPKAGNQTTRIILVSYAINVFIGLIASIIFVLGLRIWSPSLISLQENPWLFVSFLLATALWSIFALQDGVLVGLRQTVWVPVENAIFALAKIGLLLLFAKFFVDYGVFASWNVPVIAICLIINWGIFKIIVPKHVKENDAEVFPLRDMAKFVGADYLSTLIWMVTIDLMPLIIIEKVGAEANAFFYLPWTIASSIYLVSRSFGMSLTVEAAKDSTLLVQYSRQSLVQTASLLIPIILVILIGADWILRIFGAQYAGEGAGLLRLLALATLPNALTTLYISISRVQRKVFRIAVILTFLCVLIISFTLLWLERFGLISVGWAWLVSETIVAGVLLFTDFRKILFPVRENNFR